MGVGMTPPGGSPEGVFVGAGVRLEHSLLHALSSIHGSLGQRAPFGHSPPGQYPSIPNPRKKTGKNPPRQSTNAILRDFIDGSLTYIRLSCE